MGATLPCFLEKGSRHCLLPLLGIQYSEAVVAEWLRRLTRNQIPSGSVGSNPTDCADLKLFFSFFLLTQEMLP